MSGVKSFIYAGNNSKYCNLIFLVVLITVLGLSFSGCVENDNDPPDELPDVYESDAEAEEGQLPDGAEVSIAQLIVTSPYFENGETIPSKYTCDGENINPSLEIRNIPDNVVSFY